MTEDTPQRDHPLHEIFNGLGWIARAGAPWRMMPNGLPPWGAVSQQTRCWPDANTAGYDGGQRKQGGQGPTAVDTLGQRLAWPVTAANAAVEMACVDQGGTADHPAQEAATRGMRLDVVKLPAAQKGFVLSPRRRIIERRIAWAARIRRLPSLEGHRRVPIGFKDENALRDVQ
jgi:transposase